MALPASIYPPGASHNPTGKEHWNPENALEQNLLTEDTPQRTSDLFEGKFETIAGKPKSSSPMKY